MKKLLCAILLLIAATQVLADMHAEQMAVGMLVERAMHKAPDKFKPEDYAQYCPDTAKIADVAIGKMKELNVFDLKDVCQEFEQRKQQCMNKINDECGRIQDVATQCPPDPAPFMQMCEQKANQVAQGYADMQAKLQVQACQQKAALYQKYCQTMQQQAAAFNKTPPDCTVPDCTFNITINVSEKIAEECAKQWPHAKEELDKICDKKQEYVNHCLNRTNPACDIAQQAADKCYALGEDDIRQYMIQQAAHICKTAQYNATHDDIVPKLLTARAQVSDEYKPILDSETDKYIEANEAVNHIQEKGNSTGYKLKKFFGLAAQEERNDAVAIRGSVQKLNETIANLQAIAEQIDNPQAKQALLEQVDRLKERQSSLDDLATQKESKARGIFSFFT